MRFSVPLLLFSLYHHATTKAKPTGPKMHPEYAGDLPSADDEQLPVFDESAPHLRPINPLVIERVLNTAPSAADTLNNPLAVVQDSNLARVYFRQYHINALDEAILRGEPTSVLHYISALLSSKLSTGQLNHLIRRAAKHRHSASLMLLVSHSNNTNALKYSVREAFIHNEPDQVDWLMRNGLPPDSAFILRPTSKAITAVRSLGHVMLNEQDPNLVYVSVDAAYQAEVRKGTNIPAVELLLREGAAVCDQQCVLFFLACASNQPEIVRLMLEHGVDPRMDDNKALKIAMLNDSWQVVLYLLEFGADYESVDLSIIRSLPESSYSLAIFKDWVSKQHSII